MRCASGIVVHASGSDLFTTQAFQFFYGKSLTVRWLTNEMNMGPVLFRLHNALHSSSRLGWIVVGSKTVGSCKLFSL